MVTPRKAARPTVDAIDQFCAQFDDLFNRRAAREALRQYLIGLLLPREHNKTLTVLAALVPGADRQRLHHFLHDAPWDATALSARRLALWRAHPTLSPHADGVLIVDETGDRKRGHRIVLAAQQYIGKFGRTASGVVSVTSHWADGTRHVPLGVRPYRPAGRLPDGKADPRFRTKPELAWELIQEARAAGIPFRVVVADCIYGENPTLQSELWAAGLRYVLAVRPHRGTWQYVPDPTHPPAFTPAQAAQRLPLDQWQRTVRPDSHGKDLVRYIAELRLGTSYGPDQPFRLIAASEDPTKLKPDATWFVVTNMPLAEATPAAVYELYRLRDWIEHYYKPAKHELGWADFQVRPEQAIVRHWQLVMLAFTVSLLAGAPPGAAPAPAIGPPHAAVGGKIRGQDHLASHAAPGAPLAVPVGTPPAVSAELVHRTATTRTRRPPRARRPLSSA
jgi:DDE superfamily endonuclease